MKKLTWAASSLAVVAVVNLSSTASAYADDCAQLWSTIQENQLRWNTMGNHPDRKYFAANAQNLINLYNQKCTGGLASVDSSYSSSTTGWDKAAQAMGIISNTLTNMENILAEQEQQNIYKQKQAEIAAIQREIDIERQQEVDRQETIIAAKKDFAVRNGIENPFAVTDPCDHLSTTADSRSGKFCKTITLGDCVPDRWRCVADNSDYYNHFASAGVMPSENPFELVPDRQDYERLLNGKGIRPKGAPKMAPKAITFDQNCENPFETEDVLRAKQCIK